MTPTRKALCLLVGAVTGSAVVVACFSDRGAGPTVNTAAECRVPVTVIDSMHYIVAIHNFTFLPDSLAVPVGATVTWVNCETTTQEPHTTTSHDAVCDCPQLRPGAHLHH